METTLTPLDALRQSQVLQVFLMKSNYPEMTIDDCCNEVGITKDIYYYWVRKEDSAINRIRELIGDNQRELLVDLVNTKKVAMMKLIEDAAKDHLKPAERIKILQYIDDQLDELQSVHHARPGIEESAHEFLKQGPVTKKQMSAKASLEIRSDNKGSVIIDVHAPDQIEDAKFHDLEDEE